MTGSAGEIKDYSKAVPFLEREPLQNQYFLMALTADVPSVPRKVYVDNKACIAAVLILEHFQYRNGTAADWIHIDAASETALENVLSMAPSTANLQIMVHRSWMKEIIQERFGIELNNNRYELTVNLDRFTPAENGLVTRLDESHLKPLSKAPPVTPPHAPGPLDLLKRQLGGENIKVYAVFDGPDIAAFATAEPMIKDIWGVHPITIKQYGGKGYGTALLSAATKDVLKMEMVPYYDTNSNEIAAIRIAEKLGYWIFQEVVYT